MNRLTSVLLFVVLAAAAVGQLTIELAPALRPALLLCFALVWWMNPRWVIVYALLSVVCLLLPLFSALPHLFVESAGRIVAVVGIIVLASWRMMAGPKTSPQVPINLPTDQRSSVQQPVRNVIADSSLNSAPLTEVSESEDAVETYTSPSESDFATNIAVALVTSLKLTGEFSSRQLELVMEEAARVFENHQQLDEHDFSIGLVIGPYTIGRMLGQGGAGKVFQATKENGDHVAIKVVHHLKHTKRFEREMRLVKKLAHPNIVVAYDVGEDQGIGYIAMEALSGPNLQELVRQQGPLPWPRTVDLIRQAASGLEQAHQRGLVHRDVKPANLILDGAHRVKVADLGLASMAVGNANRDTEGVTVDEEFLTIDNHVAGTPDFMAPEQARSLASASIQSDIYSLGASWHYLLTGKSRHASGSYHEKIKSLLLNEPLGKVCDHLAPIEIRSLLEMMVAPKPEHRLESMEEVILQLDKISSESHLSPAAEQLSVLIVEDDEDDLFIAVEMLRRSNQSVLSHEAHCLADAIEILRSEERVDVILLDLQLPDSSGKATVVELLVHSGDVPIIVLSGDGHNEVAAECIQAGASEFTCKSDLTPHQLERILFITQSRARTRSALEQ